MIGLVWDKPTQFYVYKNGLIEMKITFKQLNIKEKLAIITACAAFTLGWILTGIAAFVPLLLSEQSILWILGQAMTYSAAVFGVSMYFNAEARIMKRDIGRHFIELDRRVRKGEDLDQPDEEYEDETR